MYPRLDLQAESLQRQLSLEAELVQGVEQTREFVIALVEGADELGPTVAADIGTVQGDGQELPTGSLQERSRILGVVVLQEVTEVEASPSSSRSSLSRSRNASSERSIHEAVWG